MGRGILVSVLLLAACTTQVPAAAPIGVPAAPTPAATRAAPAAALDGVVRDASGAPVAGAWVTLVPPTAPRDGEAITVRVRTAATGAFRFETLPPARYALTATATGHAAALAGLVEVGAGAPPAHAEVRLLPSQGFVLSGSVRDTAAAPLPGVEVVAMELDAREGAVFATETDGDGRYAIDLVPGVPYLVAAAARGRPHAFHMLDESRTTADLVLLGVAPPRPPDASLAAWLAGAAMPIASLTPGVPRQDLASLRAAMGTARVIGLGEAAHGAADPITLRHRVLEVLAAEGPFVLALEAGFGECVALDDWLTSGKGDPVAALRKVMSWPMLADELVAVLRWMRKQNEGPRRGDPLRIAGVDVTTWGSKAALLAYLARADAALHREAETALAPFGSPAADGAYGARDRESKLATRAAIARLIDAFAQRRAGWVARTGAAAVERAAAHLEDLRDAERALGGATTRDRIMGDRIVALARHPPASRRVVVWGHNAHIAHAPGVVNDMGQRVREALGADYFALGFTFGGGTVRVQDPGDGYRDRLLPLDARDHPRGLEAALSLHDGPTPAYAVDLRHAPPPVAAWLGSFMDAWNMGSVYRGEAGAATLSVVPARAYDAVVFVRRTIPSQALPAPGRTAPR